VTTAGVGVPTTGWVGNVFAGVTVTVWLAATVLDVTAEGDGPTLTEGGDAVGPGSRHTGNGRTAAKMAKY
jgi:hypothetical protein